jgi:hypothetical protein
MTKYLDKGKVEKAFKRAARTAVSGSRDARSGRSAAEEGGGRTALAWEKSPPAAVDGRTEALVGRLPPHAPTYHHGLFLRSISPCR